MKRRQDNHSYSCQDNTRINAIMQKQAVFTLRLVCIFVFLEVFKVEGRELSSYTFPSNLNKCYSVSPLFKARTGSLQMCLLECQLRTQCEGVNYYRQSKMCELVDNADSEKLTLNSHRKACVSARKTNMHEISGCPVCKLTEVCDRSTNSCKINECQQFGPVQNGNISGNMLVINSSLKVECDPYYQPEPPQGMVICKADGTWEPDAICVPECLAEEDLVSGPNGISDDAFTASSSYGSNYYPFHCRLDYLKAWASRHPPKKGDYIQFDFTTLKLVTGIITQGYASPPEWVELYTVLNSTDCSTFTSMFQDFTGNSDVDSHVAHTFPFPVLARCIRVVAQEFHIWVTMRIALIGC